MADNRGVYDPRQFLHYPDKDPFSEESQRRLDDLIQDFLRAGIAFANGASANDLTIQRRGEKQNEDYINQLELSSPEIVRNHDGEPGDFEDRVVRLDKGKGRDEREGPGLRGLWAQSMLSSSPTPQSQSNTRGAATSPSRDIEYGNATFEQSDHEEEEDSYLEEHLQNGIFSNDDEQNVYEEGSETGTELERVGSEQDVIYIDSDEGEPESRAFSDADMEERRSSPMLDYSEASRMAYRQSSASELNGTRREGSQFEVYQDGNELEEEDEGPDRKQDSPKEFDEGEEHSFENKELWGEGEAQITKAGTNPTTRDLFTDLPIVDPWISSTSEKISELPAFTHLARGPQGLWSTKDGVDANQEAMGFHSPNNPYFNLPGDVEANVSGSSPKSGRSVDSALLSPSVVTVANTSAVEGPFLSSFSGSNTIISASQEPAVSANHAELRNDIAFSPLTDERRGTFAYNELQLQSQGPTSLPAVTDPRSSSPANLIFPPPSPNARELSNGDDVLNVHRTGNAQMSLPTLHPMEETSSEPSLPLVPKDSQDRVQQLSNVGGVSRDVETSLGQPSSSLLTRETEATRKSSSPLEGEEYDSDEYPSTSTALHPAIFDDKDRNVGPIYYSDPLASIGPNTEGNDSTSAESSQDTTILEPHKVSSESYRKVEQEELKNEEVLHGASIPNGGISSSGNDKMIFPDSRRINSAENYEHMADQGRPAQSTIAPRSAISIGSSTPPLSPPHTVKNESSIPDHSIASFDLSTGNPATVSVVTSTPSPSPIHVSRPSPVPADIRQSPTSRAGFTSGSEEEEGTVLPDPRLPPEPTHLRIPVGVMNRDFIDHREEEKAESVKVEPPTPHIRDGSEDGSVPNISELPINDEKRHQNTESEVAMEGSQEDLVVPEILRGSREPYPMDELDNAEPVLVEEDGQEGEQGSANILPELTYPDSDSDTPSKGRTGSVSSTDKPFFTSEGRERTLSPIHEGSTTPKKLSVNSQQDLSSTSRSNGPQGSLINGSLGLLEPTVDMQIDDEPVSVEDIGDIKSSTSLPEAASPSTVPPVINDVSPEDVGHSVRGSTESKKNGKGRTTALHDTKGNTESPKAARGTEGRKGTTPRKRSRTSEARLDPPKQRRITRSAAANLSPSQLLDHPASVDDESDASSIASSSSAVSHILHLTDSESSPGSPSIVSQSPTSSMASPIRPYVPHNHNHRPPVSGESITSPRQRTTPVSDGITTQPLPASGGSSTLSTHLTRASCTDHKISIPSPNGLLYFLIPRCSLLDPEVEKDDSVVDCGVATRDEVDRAVGDLEVVGLDPQTLLVIRHLAGVELMREGQVGYLPRPGERIRKYTKHKRLHIPPPSVDSDVAAQVDLGHTSGSDTPHPDQMGSPAQSSRSSLLEASRTDDSSDYETLVRSGDHVDHESTTSNEEAEKGRRIENIVQSPLSTPSKPTRSKTRRRGLKTDDAAYNPENDAAQSSSEAESLGPRKRTKGTLKRRRSEASASAETTTEGVEYRTTPGKKRQRGGGSSPSHNFQENNAGPSRKHSPTTQPAGTI